MSDHLRDELGKMLDRYDEERRVVQAREQKVRDDDAQFLARFAEIRRVVVRPVFETAAAMLAERGHRASIEEQEFTVGAGGKPTEAEILIRVVPAGSEATGRDAPGGALAISTRHYSKTVWINNGKPTEGTKNTYPLDRLDQQLIEEQLLKFVGGIVAG